jgi:hypothetical protein
VPPVSGPGTGGARPSEAGGGAGEDRDGCLPGGAAAQGGPVRAQHPVSGFRPAAVVLVPSKPAEYFHGALDGSDAGRRFRQGAGDYRIVKRDFSTFVALPNRPRKRCGRLRRFGHGQIGPIHQPRSASRSTQPLPGPIGKPGVVFLSKEVSTSYRSAYKITKTKRPVSSLRDVQHCRQPLPQSGSFLCRS